MSTTSHIWMGTWKIADSSRIYVVILHENKQWRLLKLLKFVHTPPLSYAMAVAIELKQGPLVKCWWSSLIKPYVNYTTDPWTTQGLEAPTTLCRQKSRHCYLCLKSEGIDGYNNHNNNNKQEISVAEDIKSLQPSYIAGGNVSY